MIKFILIGILILLVCCVITSVVTWQILRTKSTPQFRNMKLPNLQARSDQRVDIYVPHSREFDVNTTGISIIVSYYNNPDGLLAQARVLSLYPQKFREHVEFIVVDDGSIEKPARDFKQKFLDILNQPWDVVFIELTEDIGFNSGGAKHTGVIHARHGRVLLIDMDCWVFPNSCYNFLHQKLNSKQFMCNFSAAFNIDPHIGFIHPNIYFIHKDDFLAIGGYDENFSGKYGCEDLDLRNRLLFHGYEMCNEEVWVSWIVNSQIGITSQKRNLKELLAEADSNFQMHLQNIANGHPIPTRMARVPYHII